MIEPWSVREHAGVTVEIVPDIEPVNYPQENDNAGTIYSWTRDFDGDERINEPEIPMDDWERKRLAECEAALAQARKRHRATADLVEEITELRSREDLPSYMRHNYDAVLTIPLRFSDYGSSGSRIYVSDDPNCALCFTQKDLDYEWEGSVDNATKYAEGRISELDDWLRGNVWGIVIRDAAGKVLESVWGFIGDPDSDWIRGEAEGMAEACAEEIERERVEAFRWACADVMTVAG